LTGERVGKYELLLALFEESVRSTTSWTVNSLPGALFISSTAASRKRWTRFSARTRAGSSDRATASSRQVSGASAAASSLMREDYIAAG